MTTNNDKLTNSIQTIPLEDVLKEHETDAHQGGEFVNSRVISTTSSVVVRQDDPAGPRDQEGLGYNFLIHSQRLPGLTRMDDGKLVLTLAVDEPDRIGDEVKSYILFSDDDGLSWSQPLPSPGCGTTPMNIGGSKLMLRGWLSNVDINDTFCLWFSDDAGQT